MYATNAGVFVSDAHGRATQLDVTGPADVVSSFSVSRDRRLFSWSVQPEFGLDRWKGSRLVVADLVAHRVDTYSWHGRPEEAEDDDVPPTVGAAPTSLVAVFHGQLVRFEDNGQVQSSTLDIPVAGAPGAPEYSPCGFSRYEALGQFNDHVLITAHYPTGGNEPGSQVLTFAPDGSDGRYEFDASGGPSDVTQPLGDGSLLFIDGGHQWRSVQRITTGESRGSSIDITPPAGPPLAGWGVMANSLTYNEGQIYVSYNVSAANYDQARTYVATIDATGAHNVDLAASWVEAGPRRSLAYIADDGRLIVRDSVGSETTIAASVTTATWTGG